MSDAWELLKGTVVVCCIGLCIVGALALMVGLFLRLVMWMVGA